MSDTDTAARRPAAGNAWDRGPNESAKAYAAFRVYLELGPVERSIAKVVEHRAKTGQGKSRSPVSGWSSKFRWQARAEAFDAEGASRADATAFEILEQRAARQAEIAVRMLDSLEIPVDELDRRLAACEDDAARAKLLEEIELPELFRTIQGAARALPRVVQVERLARGQSTTNVGGHDGGPIETESRVAAERWAKEATPDELETFLLGAQTQREVDEKKATPKRKAKAKR